MKMKRSYPGSRNTTIIAVSLSLWYKCFGTVSSGYGRRRTAAGEGEHTAGDGHKAHAKGPNEIQVRAG